MLPSFIAIIAIVAALLDLGYAKYEMRCFMRKKMSNLLLCLIFLFAPPLVAFAVEQVSTIDIRCYYADSVAEEFFDSKGTATRAEASAVLHRFVELATYGNS